MGRKKLEKNLTDALENLTPDATISTSENPEPQEKNPFDTAIESVDNESLAKSTVSPDDIPPVKGSKEWSDYVMKQFDEDELQDGNPTVDGLRRVVELLLGTIVESISIVTQVPSKKNGYTACAQCSISYERWNGASSTFQDVADVTLTNCDPKYAVFATAVASTRAEGRALRKALQLKKVVAAEEMNVSGLTVDDNDNKKIDVMQTKIIKRLCEQNDINVVELLKSSKSGPFTSIGDVPHNVAAKMIHAISEMQRLDKVQENLKGYKPDWDK